MCFRIISVALLIFFCSISFFRAFFGSLYTILARGARAVFQVYPETVAQRELILGSAMRAGFAGGVVIDYPHRYARGLVRPFL